eukprot:scaffold1206_cov388-Prasinococcus_capsulatus_cf.AAC.53
MDGKTRQTCVAARVRTRQPWLQAIWKPAASEVPAGDCVVIGGGAQCESLCTQRVSLEPPPSASAAVHARSRRAMGAQRPQRSLPCARVQSQQPRAAARALPAPPSGGGAGSGAVGGAMEGSEDGGCCLRGAERRPLLG